MSTPRNGIGFAVLTAAALAMGGCAGGGSNRSTASSGSEEEGLTFSSAIEAMSAPSAEAYRLAGYRAYRDGNMDLAQDHFESAVYHRAGDWRSHYYLGLIGLEHLNDPLYASRHLEIAYEIRVAKADVRSGDTNPYQPTAPWPNRGQIVEALAQSLHRQDDTARLFAFLHDVADQYGHSQDYMRLARYFYKAGDPDGARTAYLQATRAAEPGDAHPFVALADFYDTLGDRGAALQELRKAYFVNPDHPGLGDKIRAHGLVPGPTVALPPRR